MKIHPLNQRLSWNQGTDTFYEVPAKEPERDPRYPSFTTDLVPAKRGPFPLTLSFRARWRDRLRRLRRWLRGA